MNNTKFKQGLSSSQKSLSVFQRQMKAVGGMIAGAFAVGSIVNFAKTAFEGLETQRKAEASLLTALKGREDVQKRLIAQASQLQRVTLYGDDETIQAQALLAAFVKEEESIKRIIPLVQDFAAAKQMDLASSADLVAKTLGSTTNALQRYGIEVSGEVGSTERLNSLIESLSKHFGGQARAIADASSGVIQLKNAWGDLKESLAEPLFPKIAAELRMINDLIVVSQSDALTFIEKWKAWNTGDKNIVHQWAEYAVKMEEWNSMGSAGVDIHNKLNQAIAAGSSALDDNTDSAEDAYKVWKKLNDKKREAIELEEELAYAIKTNLDNQLKLISEPVEKIDSKFSGDGLWDYLINPPENIIEPEVDNLISKFEKFRGVINDVRTAALDLGVDFAKSLGYTIGAAESFKETLSELGAMIFDALGSIMIAAGIQTGQWGLVAAGLGVILMGGLAKGLQSRMEARAEMNGNVRFEIEGDKLVGVMGRYNKKDRYR
jgi:hypothetical protein